MRTRPSAQGRRQLNVSHGSWESIWELVGRVLVMNLGFFALSLPLVVGLTAVPRPWEYPAFLAALALPVGPAVVASFDFLRRGDDATSVRHWLQSLRSTFGRALLLWAPAVAAGLVIACDVVYLHDSPIGAALVPLFVVLGLLTAAATVPGACLVATDEPPACRTALALSFHAVVRRPGFAAFNLVLLGSLVFAIAAAPLVALAALPGFIFIVWWRNGTHVIEALGAAVPDPAVAPCTDPPPPSSGHSRTRGNDHSTDR